MNVRSEILKMRCILGNLDTYKIDSGDLWTEQSYELFISNLWDADNDFFLGTMLIETKDLIVIDGACRLVACYATLIAIRDLAMEIDTDLSNKLSERCDSIYLSKNCDGGKKFLDTGDALEEHFNKRVSYLKNSLRMRGMDKYTYYKLLNELGDKILDCDINVVCAEGVSCFRMMSDIKLIPSKKELNLELDIPLR